VSVLLDKLGLYLTCFLVKQVGRFLHRRACIGVSDVRAALEGFSVALADELDPAWNIKVVFIPNLHLNRD
jgi:hypothetical protein